MSIIINEFKIHTGDYLRAIHGKGNIDSIILKHIEMLLILAKTKLDSLIKFYENNEDDDELDKNMRTSEETFLLIALISLMEDKDLGIKSIDDYIDSIQLPVELVKNLLDNHYDAMETLNLFKGDLNLP